MKILSPSNEAKLEQLRANLVDLGKTWEPKSMKAEILERLKNEIADLKRKRVPNKRIAEMIQGGGFAVSHETIRQFGKKIEDNQR